MLIDQLGGFTSQLLNLMLDVTVKRQESIANNIANVQTPGYSAKTFRFDDIVSEFIMSATGDPHPAAEVENISRIRSELNSPDRIVESTGEQVRLDDQIVQLTENVLRYQALLEAAAKRGSLMKLAINGGR